MKEIYPTDEQWSILNRAIDLLRPFDKEERTNWMTYYTDKDSDYMSSEYDTCDDEKCIQASKKNIRRSYGNRKIIEENHVDTSTDYESFERCCICGKYFNEFLTWIRQEFEHHEEYSISTDDFVDSRTAYELRGIYDSLHWNCDNQISGYARHQYFIGNNNPLNDTLKRQQDLIDRVVKHATLVIVSLENYNKSL